MIGGTEKSSKHVLPRIEEDIHRSTDSLSTLSSDTRTLKSLEGDLFEDVRASIQKSSMASNVANSNSKKKLGVAESQTIQCEYTSSYTSSFVTRENSFKYLVCLLICHLILLILTPNFFCTLV